MVVGWSDIKPEFVVDNVDHLLEFIDKPNNKFSNVIRKQVFWVHKEEHKFRWLPETTESDFKI